MFEFILHALINPNSSFLNDNVFQNLTDVRKVEQLSYLDLSRWVESTCSHVCRTYGFDLDYVLKTG